MKITIDATNIKAGGGLVHLKQIIENSNLNNINLELIGGTWLSQISDRHNVTKKYYSRFFSNIIKQELFKKIRLPKILSNSDLIFVPGGTFTTIKKPYVSMSQNMLVFEEKERNRFPFSLNKIRYLLLEKIQLKSFKNASGIIYISNYAKNYIENKYPFLKDVKSKVIYHGISNDFRQEPKKQYPIKKYTKEKPFRLLYISIINYYKHQWNVVEAVKRLKNEGFNIELDLIGPIYEPVREKFEKSLLGGEGYITYHGKVPYNSISSSYKKADLFIFASTCENMPNILVEAMSAGLPILSSNYGPMPEILKDAGHYMDPTDIESIYNRLKEMLENDNMRKDYACKAFTYSQDFSWQKASKETLDFLESIYLSSNN